MGSWLVKGIGILLFCYGNPERLVVIGLIIFRVYWYHLNIVISNVLKDTTPGTINHLTQQEINKVTNQAHILPGSC